MKQTAVEFLLNELKIEDLAKGENLSVILDIFRKAKEIEKEQIMKANIDGYQEAENYIEKSAEQYYNENYKN